ncbi:dTDP-glucose 4,6-dehydratase [Marinicella sp. S1101]|uniref:dTDP-glucose 4,6-dehydratase n=1 Tax=Marinicella marina TaxID=2996016 RepID=UPI002260E29F|nr:dTDP-glucose 4,6-dehydratase [Marinicella marina]MCX7553457.1 dTDP-glucose 4,6-dehydratase [Marinicella marina]MDJ1140081.1 dTDP-glucose 4,6-dehydratase [Marinicella marina]
MTEKWLVTGGAGFIGGNFVLRQVLKNNRQVINLDKLSYAGNLDTLQQLAGNPNHKFIHGDINDSALLSELIAREQPDVIVHFAAESHVDRSIEGPEVFIETNVMGTFNLLQHALNYYQTLQGDKKQEFRFLHVSTDEVYGSLGETGSFTETTPYAPNSPYSASKAASDHLVRAYHHTYNLPVLTTNCSNNYGPFQFPEKLIPLMIEKALSGEDLPIYGDGKNVRDWLFVEDHCRAIETVIEKGRLGEVYNVGGNEEKQNIEIVHTICDLIDDIQPTEQSTRAQITYVDDRPGHDRRYAIDASKLLNELNWQPKETFESGIRRTIQWYLDNRDWVERVKDGSYQGQRLGQSIQGVNQA